MFRVALVLSVLAAPAVAQTAEPTVVQFTGFLGNLQFKAADVRADLMDADSNDMYRIAIAMNETATAAFTQFTTVHINQSVSFFVCGQQMQSVTVQTPIDSGFALSDPLAFDQATQMVAALNGQGDCP